MARLRQNPYNSSFHFGSLQDGVQRSAFCADTYRDAFIRLYGGDVHVHLTTTCHLFMAATLAAAAALPALSQTPADERAAEFTATVHASNPTKNWRGETWYLFSGVEPLQAAISVMNTGFEKETANIVIGTEKSTVDFGDGDTFQLITRFIVSGGSSKTGVYRIVQNGTIANGTGIFKGATGIFSHTGYFGPGLRSDTATGDWTGVYEGTLVGVDFETMTAKAARQIAARPTPAGAF
jgi:hypothetical protein